MQTFLEVFKEWDESDHPRDEEGKFTEGSGGLTGTNIKNDPKALASAASPKANQKAWERTNNEKIKAAAVIGLGVVFGTAGSLFLLRRGEVPVVLARAFPRQQPATTATVEAFAANAIFKETGKGADEVANLVKKTLSNLPASHIEALQRNGITFVALNNLVGHNAAFAGVKTSEVINSYQGLYNAATKSVVVGRNMMLGGKPIPFKQAHLEKTILHETGHAMDFMGGVGGTLSKNTALIRQFETDFAKMPLEVQQKAQTYWAVHYGSGGPPTIYQEAFSDLYAAKYMKSVSDDLMFFGDNANKASLLNHFKSSLNMMGKLDTKAVGVPFPSNLPKEQAEMVQRLRAYEDAVRTGRILPSERPSAGTFSSIFFGSKSK